MVINNYTKSQRALHKLSLCLRPVREISFDLEKALYLKTSSTMPGGEHVFVAGLARSGTTVLLNMLFAGNQFASLTYSDMPFILSPNLWNNFVRTPHHSVSIERAHGDGVMISINSPEAFEEVFWNTFEKDPKVVQEFKNYVGLITLKYKRSRYLSKNNQNVRRIFRIQEAFPDAKILIPFRNPLQQANSLLTQHIRISSQQINDKYMRNYMRWIGHSEFGIDYRPISQGNRLKYKDFNTLNHWLEQWLYSYRSLFGKYGENKNIMFVCYEDLCRDKDGWDNLATFLDVEFDNETTLDEVKKKVEAPFDDNLLKECIEEYELFRV